MTPAIVCCLFAVYCAVTAVKTRLLWLKYSIFSESMKVHIFRMTKDSRIFANRGSLEIERQSLRSETLPLFCTFS